MKKGAIIAIFLLFIAGTACAATGPTEEDYKNLEQLRGKLVRMKREMDSFIKDIVATYPDQQGAMLDNLGQDVKVDVTETDKFVIVRADLPGMSKDKINVTLDNNKLLKISGKREIMKSQTSPGVVRKERMEGEFARVLELPTECMSEGIAATYKDGVLELVIPKKEKTKTETVKIKVQ